VVTAEEERSVRHESVVRAAEEMRAREEARGTAGADGGAQPELGQPEAQIARSADQTGAMEGVAARVPSQAASAAATAGEDAERWRLAAATAAIFGGDEAARLPAAANDKERETEGRTAAEATAAAAKAAAAEAVSKLAAGDPRAAAEASGAAGARADANDDGICTPPVDAGTQEPTTPSTQEPATPSTPRAKKEREKAGYSFWGLFNGLFAGVSCVAQRKFGDKDRDLRV
jgi:hypothetical protein